MVFEHQNVAHPDGQINMVRQSPILSPAMRRAQVPCGISKTCSCDPDATGASPTAPRTAITTAADTTRIHVRARTLLSQKNVQIVHEIIRAVPVGHQRPYPSLAIQQVGER